MNKNYTLIESFHKANIQDRLWYVMGANDLKDLKENESLSFGDKAYIIKTKEIYVMGNDNIFYLLGGSGKNDGSSELLPNDFFEQNDNVLFITGIYSAVLNESNLMIN